MSSPYPSASPDAISRETINSNLLAYATGVESIYAKHPDFHKFAKATGINLPSANEIIKDPLIVCQFAEQLIQYDNCTDRHDREENIRALRPISRTLKSLLENERNNPEDYQPLAIEQCIRTAALLISSLPDLVRNINYQKFLNSATPQPELEKESIVAPNNQAEGNQAAQAYKDKLIKVNPAELITEDDFSTPPESSRKNSINNPLLYLKLLTQKLKYFLIKCLSKSTQNFKRSHSSEQGSNNNDSKDTSGPGSDGGNSDLDPEHSPPSGDRKSAVFAMSKTGDRGKFRTGAPREKTELEKFHESIAEEEAVYGENSEGDRQTHFIRNNEIQDAATSALTGGNQRAPRKLGKISEKFKHVGKLNDRMFVTGVYIPINTRGDYISLEKFIEKLPKSIRRNAIKAFYQKGKSTFSDSSNPIENSALHSEYIAYITLAVQPGRLNLPLPAGYSVSALGFTNNKGAWLKGTFTYRTCIYGGVSVEVPQNATSVAYLIREKIEHAHYNNAAKILSKWMPVPAVYAGAKFQKLLELMKIFNIESDEAPAFIYKYIRSQNPIYTKDPYVNTFLLNLNEGFLEGMAGLMAGTCDSFSNFFACICRQTGAPVLVQTGIYKNYNYFDIESGHSLNFDANSPSKELDLTRLASSVPFYTMSRHSQRERQAWLQQNHGLKRVADIYETARSFRRSLDQSTPPRAVAFLQRMLATEESVGISGEPKEQICQAVAHLCDNDPKYDERDNVRQVLSNFATLRLRLNRKDCPEEVLIACRDTPNFDFYLNGFNAWISDVLAGHHGGPEGREELTTLFIQSLLSLRDNSETKELKFSRYPHLSDLGREGISENLFFELPYDSMEGRQTIAIMLESIANSRYPLNNLDDFIDSICIATLYFSKQQLNQSLETILENIASITDQRKHSKHTFKSLMFLIHWANKGIGESDRRNIACQKIIKSAFNADPENAWAYLQDCGLCMNDGFIKTLRSAGIFGASPQSRSVAEAKCLKAYLKNLQAEIFDIEKYNLDPQRQLVLVDYFAGLEIAQEDLTASGMQEKQKAFLKAILLSIQHDAVPIGFPTPLNPGSWLIYRFSDSCPKATAVFSYAQKLFNAQILEPSDLHALWPSQGEESLMARFWELPFIADKGTRKYLGHSSLSLDCSLSSEIALKLFSNGISSEVAVHFLHKMRMDYVGGSPIPAVNSDRNQPGYIESINLAYQFNQQQADTLALNLARKKYPNLLPESQLREELQVAYELSMSNFEPELDRYLALSTIHAGVRKLTNPLKILEEAFEKVAPIADQQVKPSLDNYCAIIVANLPKIPLFSTTAAGASERCLAWASLVLNLNLITRSAENASRSHTDLFVALMSGAKFASQNRQLTSLIEISTDSSASYYLSLAQGLLHNRYQETAFYGVEQLRSNFFSRLRQQKDLLRRYLQAKTGKILIPDAGDDLESLHEFKPGDNFRRIDWGATARNGSILVRRYQEQYSKNLTVYLDMEAAGLNLYQLITILQKDHSLSLGPNPYILETLQLMFLAERENISMRLVLFGRDSQQTFQLVQSNPQGQLGRVDYETFNKDVCRSIVAYSLIFALEQSIESSTPAIFRSTPEGQLPGYNLFELNRIKPNPDINIFIFGPNNRAPSLSGLHSLARQMRIAEIRPEAS